MTIIEVVKTLGFFLLIIGIMIGSAWIAQLNYENLLTHLKKWYNS